jgi:cation diffusion facilitator CzcD-associated flavoprotein CzcO
VPPFDHEVVVIGAGFSGIGTSIALQRAGFDDHVLLDEADDVGGTWHLNRYPGVAVDIPSFSYQFSFERSTRWSRVYAPGKELRAYAHHCADKYGVRERVRFNTSVNGARFDEDAHVWQLRTADGDTITARYVIGATGAFAKPKKPDIQGLGDFAGPTMHTARWDHSVDLAGKRVGIIGTGASAVQVIPAIADKVEHLTVFQRTPIWCLPKPDRAMPGALRWAMEKIPLGDVGARLASQAFVEATFALPAHFAGVLPWLQSGAENTALRFLKEQVHDPEVRRKLTPDYRLGCKRPSFHNEYLATFNRDDVFLETAPITRITKTGVTVEGDRHPLDVLILATGFSLFDAEAMPPFPVLGRDGVDLSAWWAENRFQAYQGASVPGFPNFFTILGPYGYNGSSFFNLIETQNRHIMRCLKRARRDGATLVEVTREANDRYFKQMLARRPRQIFFQGGCETANSYYFDRHGDVPFRASPSLEVALRSARFDLNDYRFAA